MPSDLCLYIENPPTRWQVIPFDGDAVESLPDVDEDLVTEVDFFNPTCLEPCSLLSHDRPKIPLQEKKGQCREAKASEITVE
jgi:hypothetical protein